MEHERHPQPSPGPHHPHGQKSEANLRLVAWEVTRNCNLSCVHCRAAATSGPYAGERGEKIEEGAFGPLGPVCGNDNIDAIFKMNNMANQLGVDMQEFGQAMAVLMHLQDRIPMHC